MSINSLIQKTSSEHKSNSRNKYDVLACRKRYAHEIYVYRGEGRNKTGKTIWKPISVLFLLKKSVNFLILNAILGYCGEEGVCQIRQELMEAPEEAPFQSKIGTTTKNQ